MKPVVLKKQQKLWDKEQKAIMGKLKLLLKNNSGIMEITMKRALQLAQEKKYKRDDGSSHGEGL